MKTNNLEVELHSQEVHEILSYIPHWIVRWGIGLILGTVALILTGTWFIKYPEIIPAQITVTSQNPPKSVVVRSAGNINLLIENGSFVHKGEPLGFIKTSADYEAVSRLQSFIEDLNLSGDSVSVKLKEINNLTDLYLGQIQSAFETFSQRSQALMDFEEIDYHQEQIKQLNQRVDDYRLLNEKLREQQNIYAEEFDIRSQKMSMDSILYNKNVISETEFNNRLLVLLQSKREKENAETMLINNQLQINELKAQVAELSLQYKQEYKQLARSVSESFDLLKSDIASWKNQYVLEAPATGTVTFFEVWSDNQYVEAGEEVMSVVPQENKLFGLLRMPVTKSGKVEIGHKVNIKLYNYPHQEYGMIIGRVEEISLVPKQEFYHIYISLPEGLETTYGNTLKFKQKMQGSAEIVTKDLRLLERIFYQLREIFSRA